MLCRLMIEAVDALLLSIRCVLSLVFLVAAVGKLLDLNGSRRALEEFGVPAGAARFGGVSLPVAELAVGVALLFPSTARWGAVGALLLLGVFAGGVARVLARGEAPDCHCFGQIHSEPAGRSTLIRSLVLAALGAVIVAAGPGPSVDGALGSLRGAEVALVAVSVLAAVLAVAVAQLWGERRRLRSELDDAIAAKAPPGLPRGTPAPEFELARVRGAAVSLTELIDPPRPTVLVFVSTGCEPCLAMLPSFGHWQNSLSGSVTLVAIFEGHQGGGQTVEQRARSETGAQADRSRDVRSVLASRDAFGGPRRRRWRNRRRAGGGRGRDRGADPDGGGRCAADRTRNRARVIVPAGSDRFADPYCRPGRRRLGLGAKRRQAVSARDRGAAGEFFRRLARVGCAACAAPLSYGSDRAALAMGSCARRTAVAAETCAAPRMSPPFQLLVPTLTAADRPAGPVPRC